MDEIIKEQMQEWAKARHYKYIKRLRNYQKLTAIQKNEILLNDCKFCGTQMCHGIFDEEYGEGCSMVDKYFTESILSEKSTQQSPVSEIEKKSNSKVLHEGDNG